MKDKNLKNKIRIRQIIIISCLVSHFGLWAQDDLDQDLEELESLISEEVTTEPAPNNATVDPAPAQKTTETYKDISIDEVELSKEDIDDLDNDLEKEFTNLEVDDFEELKNDLKDDPLLKELEDEKVKTVKEVESNSKDLNKIATKPVNADEDVIDGVKKQDPSIFDVGKEEKELLEIAKFVQNKLPEEEWTEISKTANSEKYEVQKGDYLWKISQQLFGSGFYYAKIWSLNPYITNPHEIEPGMVLSFDTGSETNLPQITVGDFSGGAIVTANTKSGDLDNNNTLKIDLSNFGDDAVSPWFSEKEKLLKQGIFVQIASEYSYEDIQRASEQSLVKEYEGYEPPADGIVIQEPSADQYDESGFDKDSKITFDFKEGFFLNTFLTTNIVQDFGKIDSARNESIFLNQYDSVYLKMDSSASVAPGDLFSIYKAHGKVSNKISDRAGFKYTIVGQLKVKAKIDDVWEAEIIDSAGMIQRDDRITVYTPKINRILKTFNTRMIEAAIIGGFAELSPNASYGDVVYIDRGRADGVEMGNVFEVYSFTDRGTGKKIARDPVYKIGELTVITLTDNFATCLVSNSAHSIAVGTIAMTKTPDKAAEKSKVKEKLISGAEAIDSEKVEDLDVDVNLDDINDDLLKSADKVELTEAELEELERKEREKSVIQGKDEDLHELEKLESEIESAEKQLNSAKTDEDKMLETESLDKLEGSIGDADPNALESLESIEDELGKKYLEEDPNSKDNPYGLTENDIEEVDELLNTIPEK